MAAASFTNGDFFGSSPPKTTDDSKFPKILLMGLRRSGKSSIQKVVFHKMSPNETLFLESTNQIVKDEVNNSSFVQFAIWDFPGQIDFFDPAFEAEKVFDKCGAIIYVIDAQDDYTEAMQKLSQTVQKAYEAKPDIKFEVFIHKVDGLSDETKMDTQRDIGRHWADDCLEHGLDGKVQLSFYLTSIYDHSIFEAFSKVVQKLIPEMSTLEGLLNLYVQNCSIEKVFLFDVLSKIYVATDSSPVDIQSYELCCDMIDVVVDVSGIYGVPEPESADIGFDSRSASTIALDNGTVLYLREVSKVLAMVCIFREDSFKRLNSGLLDYNFTVIRTAVNKTFEVRRLEEDEVERRRTLQQAGAGGGGGGDAAAGLGRSQQNND